MAFSRVFIDGVDTDPARAAIPVGDVGFVRGYGVFEVIKATDGVCFRLSEHLDRLARSASMLGIELPDRDEIGTLATKAADGIHSAIVRVLVSAGDDPWEGPCRVVVTGETASPQMSSLRLLPVPAPWHSDGEAWALLRGKTLSYANNFASIRQAKLAGFDDAVLIGRSGRILEGPTFTVGWVVEENDEVIYETPAMTTGILDSITREAVFDAASEAGLTMREVEAGLDRLDAATEFYALSTLRDVVSVTAVGERDFPEGPATLRLRTALLELMDRELTTGR
jgi:branched-subunit amino acid aminotransferase/4-amino-4-deoxychorismate lyase